MVRATTALKTICGLLNHRSGEVLFQGENINGKQPYQLVEKGLCLVPEGRRVFTSMTVLENLEMGAFTVSSGQWSVNVIQFEFFSDYLTEIIV